jgi:hypothetical protein
MPNGRSGGFLLKTADLKQLVAESSHAESIALLVDGGPPLRPVTAADLRPLIDSVKVKRVAVEEQDHRSYIIHISKEPVLWIYVHSDSTLLAPLRERHTRWQRMHPLWRDWIGF